MPKRELIIQALRPRLDGAAMDLANWLDAETVRPACSRIASTNVPLAPHWP